MLVKLKYKDVQNTALKVTKDGRDFTCFMRIEVDETNLITAIDKYAKSNAVVAFDYTGSYDFIKKSTIDECNLSKVYITIDAKDSEFSDGVDSLSKQEIIPDEKAQAFLGEALRSINSYELKDFMDYIPKSVQVVIKLCYSYCDMRTIEEYSKLYQNVHFCGGQLLRLPSCNIGCIGVKNIKKNIREDNLPILANGCGCVMSYVDLGDVDSFEFYSHKNVIQKAVKQSNTTSVKPNGLKNSVAKFAAIDDSF